MAFGNSLCIAFAMYSVIPVPCADWTKKNMRYVMALFPCVGTVVGAAVWLAGLLLFQLPFGKLFDAAVLAVMPVILTGGIHMDGFLDTVDAMHSWQSPEKRLEILKDPHVGAFAVLGAAVYFLLALGIWSEVDASMLPPLAAGFVWSRVLSGYAAAAWKNARTGGLLYGFHKDADVKWTKVLLILQGVGVWCYLAIWEWRAAICVAVGTLLVYAYYRYIAYKYFGGITGDLAGWFLQLCELVFAGSLVIGEKLWF